MPCSAQVDRARGRESWRVEAIQLGGSKREPSMKVGSDHEQVYRASHRYVAAAHHDLARQGHCLAAVEAGVDRGDQAHRRNAVAAEVEEGVVDADVVDTEHLGVDAGQDFFEALVGARY